MLLFSAQQWVMDQDMPSSSCGKGEQNTNIYNDNAFGDFILQKIRTSQSNLVQTKGFAEVNPKV